MQNGQSLDGCNNHKKNIQYCWSVSILYYLLEIRFLLENFFILVTFLSIASPKIICLWVLVWMYV